MQRRTPVSYKQLCVIAKAILRADLTIENFEWSERIKSQILRARLDYPENPSAIHDAMRAIERLVPRLAPTIHPLPNPEIEEPTAEALAMRDRFIELARYLAVTHRMPTMHGATKTAEQIAAWRSEQFANRKPTHRKTAKGWVRL